jgi:hypothetical protein
LDPTIACDVTEALTSSCGRPGCHNATFRYADLVLVDASTAPAALVDVPALHGDINCAAAGQPFRECTPAELASFCPTGVLLIDSQNPEESWMLKKLRGEQSACGAEMPQAPGNSLGNGWSEERRQCLEAWIYWLAAGAPVR